MDYYVDERDFELLRQDKYTFSVLARILREPFCKVVRTNHEDMMLCQSQETYPVWMWTRDGADERVLDEASRLAFETIPVMETCCYNMKYDLAECFIKNAQNCGLHAEIQMNLFAYACGKLETPQAEADGAMYCCTESDIPEAAQLIEQFRKEAGESRLEQTALLGKARQFIVNHAFFFWKNTENKTVACCAYKIDSKLACISSVYTKPEYRRKYYAQNLVHQVTRFLIDKGLEPMLYTDADYAASNACYEKLGYQLKGKLCTVVCSK